MAKLRNFQFLRNNTIAEPFASYGAARTAAETAFADIINTLLDGEIALYSYKLTDTQDTVHTLLGIKRNGGIEILGNYDELTTEYQLYVRQQIEGLDSSAIIATNDNGVVTLKAGIVQTDGIVSQGTGADIELAKVATTGAAADVSVSAIEGLTATTVQGALTNLQGDITALQAIDPVVTTVAAGTGISVTPSATTEDGNDVTYTVAADFTVDTKKYPTESTAEGYDANKAGKTYIRIMDGETIISETDAAAFVKDGFLQEVTQDNTNNTIKFTWNTDAGVQETTISIKDLCDVYTVGEGLVATEEGYKFSHQAGATGLTVGTAFGSGSVSDDGNKITVKVPSVTVDKFGHVSELTETEVSLEIPASVASAVQTINGHDINDSFITTTVTSSDNNTTQTIAVTAQIGSVANDTAGLAEATEVKDYVDGKIEALDAVETSTDGTNVQVKVTEVNGVITAVNVTTDNTINATDLTNAIEALDATVRGTSDGVMTENSFDVTGATDAYVAVEVVETDGKLTAVNVKENIDETIQAKINALDTTSDVTIASNTNGVVTLKAGIAQENGLIKQGTGANITLAKVATTGKAEDVSVVDTEGVIAATTVEGALVEIAKEIDAMDYNVSDEEGFQPTAQGEKVKVTIQQKDGKITNVAVDETALENALDELEAATTLEGVDAIKVDYKETANTVSLKIPDYEKVLSQDENGLISTIALSYDSATTKIKLTGIDGANLGEIDATDFVKDGILQDVVIVKGTGVAEEGQTQVLENGHRYFRFTYKTVYYDENNETVDTTQVVYLDVESLVDTYTPGNAWIEIDPDVNTISHKTQAAFTPVEGQPDPQTAFGGDFIEGSAANDYEADATLDTAGTSIVFNVPSFIVDAAGHVKKADDKTIKVALPAAQTAADVKVTPNGNLASTNVQSALEELQDDIDDINGVTWTGDAEINVDNDKHTIKHTEHTVTPSTSTNNTAVKSVVIPQLTVNDYGHVTAIDNKTFTIDCNITTVSGTAKQIVVTPTVTEGSEDVNYTVSLAGVTVAQKSQDDDYAAPGTEEAPKNTHTRVENIIVDAYGRVTEYTLTTVKEDFDAGTY